MLNEKISKTVLLIRLIHIACLLGVLLFCFTETSAQSPSFTRLDSIIYQGLEKTGPLGLVIFDNQHFIYLNNYGGEEGQNFLNTISAVGSGTKWLTAATILTLVDDGLLDLDDKISEYIPRFVGPKGKVTIRQLLSHTSGLQANSLFINDTTISFEKSINKVAKSTKLKTKPGLVFTYGAVSFEIAGRIAEVVTGKEWSTIFYERIAKPCNMGNTFYNNRSPRYVSDGLETTAADYANFLMMLLNDGFFKARRVLSSKAIGEMLKDHTSKLPIGNTPYDFKSAQNSNYYGLGVWIDEIDPKRGHSVEVSSPGATGFTPLINLCQNTGMIIAYNTTMKRTAKTIKQIRREADRVIADSCRVFMTDQLRKNVVTDLSVLNYAYEENTEEKANVIEFKLEKRSKVKIRLFDSLGNPVKEIADSMMEAGTYKIPIPEDELYAGLYFYNLTINEDTRTQKVVVKK